MKPHQHYIVIKTKKLTFGNVNLSTVYLRTYKV